MNPAWEADWSSEHLGGCSSRILAKENKTGINEIWVEPQSNGHMSIVFARSDRPLPTVHVAVQTLNST
jgi:hypothetical protein